MLITWCMGVTLLTFIPSRVAKRPIKIRNENVLTGHNGHRHVRAKGFAVRANPATK
jgi:hypothetical protein